MKAGKTGKAACSRGVGCTPGGTSKAKSAANGLALVTPATGPKHGRKAEPKKGAAGAATGAEAATHYETQDQQECRAVVERVVSW